MPKYRIVLRKKTNIVSNEKKRFVIWVQRTTINAEIQYEQYQRLPSWAINYMDLLAKDCSTG